jgi:hypothetical protein
MRPERSRPEQLILTHLPVPPCCIRPSVAMGVGQGSNEDDLTVRLVRRRIHLCHEEEDTCMSYAEEDTFISYEEEDTCMSYRMKMTRLAQIIKLSASVANVLLMCC